MGFELLIGPVADLIKTTINKIWGDKISEADKLRLQIEMEKALREYDWKSVEKEYDDRASARILAAADVSKGNWFSTVLSATVRPVFGYVVMAAFVASWVPALVPGGQNFVVITDIQKDIMLSVIYFFFGGRTIEKGMKLWTDAVKKEK